MVEGLLIVLLLVIVVPAFVTVFVAMGTVILGTITAAAGAWYELVHWDTATTMLYPTAVVLGYVVLIRYIVTLRRLRGSPRAPLGGFTHSTTG